MTCFARLVARAGNVWCPTRTFCQLWSLLEVLREPRRVCWLEPRVSVLPAAPTPSTESRTAWPPSLTRPAGSWSSSGRKPSIRSAAQSSRDLSTLTSTKLFRILPEMETCLCSTSTSRIRAWFSTTRTWSTPSRISLQPSAVWLGSARGSASSALSSSSTSSLSDGAFSFVVRKSEYPGW